MKTAAGYSRGDRTFEAVGDGGDTEHPIVDPDMGKYDLAATRTLAHRYRS